MNDTEWTECEIKANHYLRAMASPDLDLAKLREELSRDIAKLRAKCDAEFNLPLHATALDRPIVEPGVTPIERVEPLALDLPVSKQSQEDAIGPVIT